MCYCGDSEWLSHGFLRGTVTRTQVATVGPSPSSSEGSRAGYRVMKGLGLGRWRCEDSVPREGTEATEVR